MIYAFPNFDSPLSLIPILILIMQKGEVLLSATKWPFAREPVPRTLLRLGAWSRGCGRAGLNSINRRCQYQSHLHAIYSRNYCA